MSDIPVDSIRSHIVSMLDELADLADSSEDPKLSELGFRLRLIASEPVLRPPGAGHS